MNHYWRHENGIHRIAKEGLRFRQSVQILARAAGGKSGRAPQIDGRVAVSVLAWMPDHRRRDLDNLLKATLDALVHAGVIFDDGLVDDLRIRRAGYRLGGAMSVTVTQI